MCYNISKIFLMDNIKMHLKVIKKNESFCNLEFSDFAIKEMIFKEFSFRPEGYKFMPKFRMGKWDGFVRLYDRFRNLFPLGLVSKLYYFCVKKNIVIEFENFDKSNTIFNENYVLDYAENILKLPFKIRDYQLDGVLKGLSERHCILLSPTGTGKSLIIYIILRLVLKYNKKFKILIVVPTLSLIDQMVGDFDDYAVNTTLNFNNLCQKIYSGACKQINKQIVVSTYQSLENIEPEYFEQFGALLVDECHTGSLKGNVNNKIASYCINAKYKIGFSGTLQDAQVNLYSLISSFGQIFQLTKTINEIERGNLSKIIVRQIVLHYPENDCKDFYNGLDELESDEGSSAPVVFNYEIDWINNKPYKSNLILDICEKYANNTLILFKRTEFGTSLFSRIKFAFINRKVFLVTGLTEKEEREKIRAICEKHNNCVIVANYRIFSTGINIKNLHNVIFGESVKSKITTLQSIGRSLRLNNNKEIANVFDIVDCIRFEDRENIIFRHSASRGDIYEKESFEVIRQNIEVGNPK